MHLMYIIDADEGVGIKKGKTVRKIYFDDYLLLLHRLHPLIVINILDYEINILFENKKVLQQDHNIADMDLVIKTLECFSLKSAKIKIIFVAFVEDKAIMSSIRYFVQNRRK